MPGDPIEQLMGNHFNINTYNLLRHKYGFDEPIYIRFFVYLGNLFTGNWGQTFVVGKGMDVWTLIWQRFPRTAELAILAIVFAAILGVNTGVISATHRNKTQDTVIRGSSLIGVAMPVFWLGLLFQLAFANKNFPWTDFFPQIGYMSVNTIVYYPVTSITGFTLIDSLIQGNFFAFWDHVQHLVLPTITLGLITLASISRQTRSSMLEVLEQDYIRTARAKGVKEYTVIHKHALNNAMIPATTIIGLSIAGLLGGAVLTENVFSYDGLGMLLVEAISDKDYFLINAITFLLTLIFVIVNLITDIIYGFLDPRIRLE